MVVIPGGADVGLFAGDEIATGSPFADGLGPETATPFAKHFVELIHPPESCHLFHPWVFAFTVIYIIPLHIYNLVSVSPNF